MSIRVMSRVWDSSQSSGGARLVLLAIADFCDDEGKAYPAVPTLARKANLSERATQYAIRELEALGELRIQPNAGRSRSNLYVVTLAADGAKSAPFKVPDGAKSAPVQNLHPAKSAPLMVQNLHPDGANVCTLTVIEPSWEPSVNSSLSHSLQTDEKGAPAPTPKKRAVSEPRGARLPADWRPSAADLGWAAANLPDVDTDDATARFCDYWQAASGQSARKSDWSAAWRNWLRNAADRRQSLKPTARMATAPRQVDATTARIQRSRAIIAEDDARMDAAIAEMRHREESETPDLSTLFDGPPPPRPRLRIGGFAP